MQTISIIGANSFLATRIRKQLLVDTSINLQLYGSNIELLSERERAFDFRLPAQQLNYESLLNSDTILYCAGAGIQSSKTYTSALIYEVNVFEPIRLLLYLEEVGFKGNVITFGTYFEIGNNTDVRAFQEKEVMCSTHTLANEYALSKRMLSQFIDSASLGYKHYHLILASIYGHGENEHRLIPYLVKQLQEHKPVHVSSGEQIRQYIHVSDVIDLLIEIFQGYLKAGIYNVAPTDSISVRTLVETVVAHIQPKANITFGDVSKTDQSMAVLSLATDKIRAHTSWRPQITLSQGINEYVIQ
ncbi:NAD(P)-dependent oxidoreductase [uncultured Cytophaga sp.]|uniref:NAD-dependent epimerase/dehydratase family protein n=1 Tax=uncultured Cytophaga sp. TaxID=160238 RepID=UPI0026039B8B|nr:NAD(P)-dependent oxidoreductase [uncultured Cytophaga sp.]